MSAVLASAALALAAPAHAQLKVIGPVDPSTGFPGYVQDAANMQVMPCSRIQEDPNEPGVNAAPCPGNEVNDFSGSFVTGNIAEFTYYRAEANMDGPDGSRYRLRIEVQGGVLPPETINNAVRLRLRNLTQTGNYTIIHPFGTEIVNVPAPGAGGLIDDIDMELPGGVLANAPNFAPAVSGNVHCFWENGTSGLVTALDPTTGQPYPAGAFLGDGVTEAPLVAKPACPGQTDAGPKGPYTAGQLAFTVVLPSGEVAATNQFTVEAQRNTSTGLLANRATYERNATGNVARVDLWVNSVPGVALTVTNGTTTVGTMLENAVKPANYYLRQRLLPAPTPTPVPATLDIAGTSVAIVDEVDILLARYTTTGTAANELEIRARSSDLYADPATGGLPTLTAYDADGMTEIGSGPMQYVGTNNFASLILQVPGGTPPEKVVVKSSRGGSMTLFVNVIGGNITGGAGL